MTTRTENIDTIIAELRRVWARNPHKTLAQVVSRATRDATGFLPDDATDAEVLAALTKIGAGQPAPDERGAQPGPARVHR